VFARRLKIMLQLHRNVSRWGFVPDGCLKNDGRSCRGAGKAGVENAELENTEAITSGKSSKQKTREIPAV